MSNAADTSLRAILPVSKTILLAGLEFTVYPLKVSQIQATVELIAPMRPMLDAGADLSTMIILHADSCLSLITLLSGKTRTEVDDMQLDDAIMLLGALLEINMDFLIRRVMPLLPRLQATVVALAHTMKEALGQEAGPTPSSN